MKILELENEPLSKLRGMAKTLNIPNSNRLKKETLAMMIREAEAQREGIELRGGILEIMSEASAFCGRQTTASATRMYTSHRHSFAGMTCAQVTWSSVRCVRRVKAKGTSVS